MNANTFLLLSSRQRANTLMSLLNTPGTVWLDTARKDPDTGRTSGLLFSNPQEVVSAYDRRSLVELLGRLDEATSTGYHAVLVLSYEAAYALHVELRDAAGRQWLGWLGIFEEPARVGIGGEGLLRERDDHSVSGFELGVSLNDYVASVESIRRAIQEGDVYQVNYTAPMHFQFRGEPASLYRSLRERQKVAYGAFANLGDRQVLSLSPELFFRVDRVDRVDGGRRITTRPMKGTVGRGDTTTRDDELAEALGADTKNRAENLMIVDLLRNDLSRVAEPGTVRVPDLYSIETYESVIQMTSTVQATLRREARLSSLFDALFPCGSVTGAPKWSAMRLIRTLESVPRGVYCGAIGYASPSCAVFNVPIRTVEIRGGEGRLGLGSGIVWDSVPEREYEECLLKGDFLTGSVQPKTE